MSSLTDSEWSAQYDEEAAIDAPIQEHVMQSFSTSSSIGFSYNGQGMLNRGRKGFRSIQQEKNEYRQSFYHLQHRYTKMITLPVVVVAISVIGLFFALISFRGFFHPTMKTLGAQTGHRGRIFKDLAGAAVDRNSLADNTRAQRFLDLEYHANQTRAERTGRIFRRRVLDTLQGMLWGTSHSPRSSQLRKAYLRAIRDNKGKPKKHHSTVDKLHAEVYHNFTHFTERYAEMNRTFKIYVYRDGFKPLVHGAKTGGIYATEGLFLKRMEDPNNRFTVSEPSKAHMFLLPYSVRQMVDILQDPYSRSMRPLKTFISNYVEALASKYPYWNRTHGADHFFVSCHDWAPLSTMLHGELHTNAMKVVCNADLTVNFDIEKDVSIPQTLKGGNQSDLDVGSLGPDERDFLAFYAGQMHGAVRPVLLDYWKGKDPLMKVYEVLPPDIALNISYSQHMKRSRYCLCPKGFEVNSPRIVEAILSGCVPVIIADNFVLPYNDVLDWTKFSVTVPEEEIPHLKKILSSISNVTYRSMQGRLRHIRRHFLWLEDPEDTQYDSFHMTLYSIWRQSMNMRRRKPEIFQGSMI